MRFFVIAGALFAITLSLLVHTHAHAQPSNDEPLGNTCDGHSDLPAHTGFQIAPACVGIEMGEVAEQSRNPQLLIVDFPEKVKPGEAFDLQVSTRNLVRDRFLPAAQGGYYLESGFLNDEGLTRGHFHVSCRMLGDADEAPTPDRQPIFIAVEDGGGGAEPDTVTVKIPGLPSRGQAQCMAWAGDGSHRMPMMQNANQMPAVDSVRVRVN